MQFTLLRTLVWFIELLSPSLVESIEMLTPELWMVITNNVVHIFKQMKNRATQWTKINSLFTERIVLTWLALVMGSHVQVQIIEIEN